MFFGKAGSMTKFKKTTLILMLVSIFSFAFVFIYGIFDAAVRWNLDDTTNIVKQTFINFGNIFNSNLWGMSRISPLSNVLPFMVMIVSILVLAFWIIYTVFTKYKPAIKHIIIFFVVSFVTVLFFSNYRDLYDVRIRSGDAMVFTFVLLIFVAFLSSLFSAPFVIVNAHNYHVGKLEAAEEVMETVTVEQNKTSEPTINESNVSTSKEGKKKITTTTVYLKEEETTTTVKTTTKSKTNPANRFSGDGSVSKERKPLESFCEKLINASPETQSAYNEVKGELLSYGLKSRISVNGDTFRLNKKTYAKITVSGKVLKLYLALNPQQYEGTTIPFSVTPIKAHEDTPFVFKVNSTLSIKRAATLIRDVCFKDDLVQLELEACDYFKEAIQQHTQLTTQS